MSPTPLVALVGDPEGHVFAALTAANFSVRRAAADAQAAAIADAAHLVVLATADGSGTAALCAAIRRDPRTRALPVIGVGGRSGRLAAIRAGVDDWFEPPVGEELRARVEVLLETAARRARETRDEAERLVMWRDQVRYLVHDLRNPLAIASGFLGLALGQALPQSELESVIADARHELDRANVMLQDMLDTERLRRGAFVAVREEVDVGDLLRGVVASARALIAPSVRADLQVEARGDLVVRVDPKLVARVLMNLLVNALRFACRAPVRVEMTGGDAAVTVRVSNDGPEVPAAIRPLLFEPWAPVTGRQGTGLGLAFCKAALAAHGGTIALESAAGGEVVFAFVLPRG